MNPSPVPLPLTVRSSGLAPWLSASMPPLAGGLYFLRESSMCRVACLLTLVSSFLLAVTGCGSNGGKAPGKTVPVKGTVTYQGKPLTKGTVRFEPDAGPEAEGEIRPDGTYEL